MGGNDDAAAGSSSHANDEQQLTLISGEYQRGLFKEVVALREDSLNEGARRKNILGATSPEGLEPGNPAYTQYTEDGAPIAAAVLGPTKVGKSFFINAAAGAEEKALNIAPPGSSLSKNKKVFSPEYVGVGDESASKTMDWDLVQCSESVITPDERVSMGDAPEDESDDIRRIRPVLMDLPGLSSNRTPAGQIVEQIAWANAQQHVALNGIVMIIDAKSVKLKGGQLFKESILHLSQILNPEQLRADDFHQYVTVAVNRLGPKFTLEHFKAKLKKTQKSNKEKIQDLKASLGIDDESAAEGAPINDEGEGGPSDPKRKKSVNPAHSAAGMFSGSDSEINERLVQQLNEALAMDKIIELIFKCFDADRVINADYSVENIATTRTRVAQCCAQTPGLLPRDLFRVHQGEPLGSFMSISKGAVNNANDYLARMADYKKEIAELKIKEREETANLKQQAKRCRAQGVEVDVVPMAAAPAAPAEPAAAEAEPAPGEPILSDAELQQKITDLENEIGYDAAEAPDGQQGKGLKHKIAEAKKRKKALDTDTEVVLYECYCKGLNWSYTYEPTADIPYHQCMFGGETLWLFYNTTKMETPERFKNKKLTTVNIVPTLTNGGEGGKFKVHDWDPEKGLFSASFKSDWSGWGRNNQCEFMLHTKSKIKFADKIKKLSEEIDKDEKELTAKQGELKLKRELKLARETGDLQAEYTAAKKLLQYSQKRQEYLSQQLEQLTRFFIDEQPALHHLLKFGQLFNWHNEAWFKSFMQSYAAHLNVDSVEEDLLSTLILQTMPASNSAMPAASSGPSRPRPF